MNGDADRRREVTDREIGARVALGAERGTVVWMIVRDALAIAMPGVLIGVLCA